MPRVKLTSAVVRHATCPSGARRLDLFDTQLAGFVLEVRAGGGKTYCVRYRDPHGRQRQVKVGGAELMTVDEARGAARQLLSRVALGEGLKLERAAVPTLAAFVEGRYLPFVKGYKRSWSVDEGYLRNHLLGPLGELPLTHIDKPRLLGLREVMRGQGLAPATCNRIFGILRYLFNLAIAWETPGVTRNPMLGLPMLKENNRRERYLKPEEARRLQAALLDSGNRQLPFIIAMLILSGARKREVMDARWVDFDLERRQWRVPMSKSGRARHVPISDPFHALLATIPRLAGCPYVVPNPATGRPYGSVFYCWDVARRQAGLADVRIHDLRHSFASYLINAGRSIYEVQKILGHANIITTQRYAHLSQATLLEAANAAGNVVGAVFAKAHGGSGGRDDTRTTAIEPDATIVNGDPEECGAAAGEEGQGAEGASRR